MPAAKLSESTRAAIAAEVRAAEADRRVPAAVARLARLYDVSPATVYRAAGLGKTRRPRQPAHPEWRRWVRIVVGFAHESPKPMPLDIALRAAVAAGDVPPEAADLPLKTLERIRRECGLRPRPQRTHRLAADYPMQVVLVDASTSEHLLVDGDDAGDGDATRLRLHRKPIPADGYKNKPLPADRRRVLVFGLWDRCTGVVRSRYCIGRGETAIHAVEFLCWALARSADRRVVLHGVPDEIWIDQGPAAKSAPARDLIERLTGQPPVLGEPYQKTRMGGVERPHRTRWERFERALFLLLRKGDTITLGELNARLQEFEVRENARASRTPVDGRPVSRSIAWVALTDRRPADNPLRELPADAAGTLAAEAPRTIDQSGIIRWDGKLYECGWHSRKVIVRRAVDGSGDLVVVDPRTGERCAAALFRPRPHGEVRSAQATALDRALAEHAARERPGGIDVYAPRPDAVVVPRPARTAPPAPLENPLDPGRRCADIGEAMRLFVSHYPHPLSDAQHARVAALLEECDLDRQAVIDTAKSLLRARRPA